MARVLPSLVRSFPRMKLPRSLNALKIFISSSFRLPPVEDCSLAVERSFKYIFLVREGLILTSFVRYHIIYLINRQFLSSGESVPMANLANQVLKARFEKYRGNVENLQYSKPYLEARGYRFERNCVLRRWESETIK